LAKLRTKDIQIFKKLGFLRVFLKNGVVGGSKNGGFIGLICFWGKNGGKN
jgi:hypothetical protein